MGGFLLQLWDMSIQLGIVIGIVILVRLVFRLGKVPKRYSYLLWAIPFLRMIFPWKIESPFSILPEETAGSSMIEKAADYVEHTTGTGTAVRQEAYTAAVAGEAQTAL